jgi:hypothetical protein
MGIIFNQDLTWHNQVAKLCRGVFFTLRRLWTFAHFTSTETRRKLVISLIVPQFLYGDVIFSKASAAIRGRLKIALNACARYIYGISKYQHITEHANKMLGCSFMFFLFHSSTFSLFEFGFMMNCCFVILF